MLGVGRRDTSIRSLIKQKPHLAAAIIRFNTDLCENLHPDQQGKWLPQLPSSFWRAPRLVERISKLVSVQVGVADKFYLEIPNPLWAMILLPPERLERLALHIGALVLGIRIRSSLSREHVMGWKTKLGEEAYRFAMNSASLLPLTQTPLPAIASDSAQSIGTSIINAALLPEPELLRKRVALKLPVDVEAMPLASDKARRLISLVIQTVEGEWYSSCVPLKI